MIGPMATKDKMVSEQLRFELRSSAAQRLLSMGIHSPVDGRL